MENTLSYTISNILSSLPKKILENKNYPILQECILYEIAHEQCLNFKEVAYFLYNPDFHLCKGLSGVRCQEIQTGNEMNHWDHSSSFQSVINQSRYNAAIKNTEFCTLFSESNIERIINEIKKSLGVDNIEYFTWQAHNNNIGILIYVKSTDDIIEKNILQDATALLSFCPMQ